MKHLLLLVSLVLFVASASADTSAHILVSLRDLGQTAVSRRAVSLTPLTPYPRTIDTNLVTRDIRRLFSDTNGLCTFSNVLWGTYRLDIWGVPSSTFALTLGTNQAGTVSAAALVTTSGLLPPNPATNYYTQAQVDALLNNATTSGLTTNVTLNLTNGTPATFWFTNGLLMRISTPVVGTNYILVVYQEGWQDGIYEWTLDPDDGLPYDGYRRSIGDPANDEWACIFFRADPGQWEAWHKELGTWNGGWGTSTTTNITGAWNDPGFMVSYSDPS